MNNSIKFYFSRFTTGM
ncbi:hypothetical protein PG447_004479 [Salmonella enterica]|nr:hypothetical protein [Salmonella enterica]